MKSKLLLPCIVSLALFAINALQASSITNATFTATGTAPNNNLTTAGTQDWQLYGGTTINQPSVRKLYGVSITMSAPVIVAPCVADSSSLRSSQTFTWTDGQMPDRTGTAVDPTSNGFSYSGNTTVAYGVNYETITFVPGDTNPHTIHLHGYISNANSGVTFRFTSSLAGATSAVTTVSQPTLGCFDYNVTFQANNPTDALTVVWTFQKTGATSAAKWMGIQAATISGPAPTPFAPVRTVNWRVISDDPNYPTNDPLVAGVVIGDATYGGYSLPANTATQDCTNYFQAAIDWMSAQAGGTIYVPPGHYRFDGSLTLRDSVTLRGRWVKPGPNQPVTGTILDIYTNAGNATGTPFLTGSGSDCGIRELAFWYPNQNATTWVPYPWTLFNPYPSAGMRAVDSITLVNSYQGYNCDGSANTCVRDVYGTTLLTGVRADNGAAVPRFEDVHLSPDYWAWSGLSNAPSPADKVSMTTQMQGNPASIGFDVGDSAGMYVINCSFSGYCYGLRSTGLNGSLYGCVITNCMEALRFDSAGSNAAKDLFCANCTFQGVNYGYHRANGLGVTLYGCTLTGGINSVLEDSTGTHHDSKLNNCLFSGPVQVGNKCDTLTIYGSRFPTNSTSNVVLNGVGQAHIACAPDANCGPSNVQGAPAVYKNTSSGYTPMPSPDFPLTYTKTRKPDKSVLFNVTNTSFVGGAYGDGGHDDTTAIQATINAAQANGGGIVFFPAGYYVVTAPLTVSNGVELRGISGTGRYQDGFGSMIQVQTGMNQASGTPLVTLGDRCGIVGLNFNYPVQSWLSGAQNVSLSTPNYLSGVYVAYPYTIQCVGLNNYLIGCASGSAYQGVDMNGAQNALIDYSRFSGFTNVLKIRGGSANCRYQNSHCIGHSVYERLWTNGTAPGVPDISNMPSPLGLVEDHFILEDSTNTVISSVYAHQAHALVTVRGNATASVLMINGEQMIDGYVFESGNGSFYALESGSNINNAGNGTGSYDWWLKPNYTGTVTYVSLVGVNTQTADFGLRVDNPGAQWNGYAVDFATGRGFWNVKTGGQVSLVGSSLPGCNLDVSAGGRLTLSQSTFDGLLYLQQPGIVSVDNNNCLGTKNSFILADMNEVPALDRGVSANTTNLRPVWTDLNLTPWTANNPQFEGNRIGYQLAGGNDYLFTVTNPAFRNGTQPSVTITVEATKQDPNGTLTVSYHSATGMKSMPVNTLSFSVTDAQFSAPDGVDIKVTANSGNPVLVKSVSVYASSYMGTQPRPPVINVPANITSEAANASGAAVTFSTSGTDYTGQAVSTVNSPASGSTFPLGTTTVNVSGTDTVGNTGTNFFTVTVQDTTAPVITVPGTTTSGATSPSGATVTFSTSANDTVSGICATTATPASGSTFPLGNTTVTVSSTDAAGNTATRTFTVTVKDLTPPVIMVPGTITQEAANAGGVVVTFSTSATDAVSGSCATTATPASGSTFPLGNTTVTVSSTDPAGNTGTKTFTVTVRDTTPPVVSVPPNITVDATSTSGAVVTFSTSATDTVSGSCATTATPASGSTFPAGVTTTVTVSATDAAGNTGTGTFTVTVRPYNNAPSINAIGNKTATQGETLSFTVTTTDPDAGQTLTYSLDPEAPAGAAIDANTGVFSWAPSDTQVAGTYPVTFRVTDNGSPAKSETQTITITVVNGVPSPWSTADIGSVGLTGSASYVNGTWNVAGAGADIWGSSDAFRFVYQTASGDCDIIARVTAVQNTNANAKTGVMIRDSLATNAMAIMSLAKPGSTIMQYRTTTGGTSAQTGGSSAYQAPCWIRVTRTGNNFSAWRSSDGLTWVQIGTTQTITMGTNVYIGLAVTAHTTTTLNNSTFTNVTAVP